MLIKWLAALVAHGLTSVLALLAAVAAIWWVEPTTPGGIAFLFFMVFIVGLAVIELVLRLVRRFWAPPAAEAPAAEAEAAAAPPSVDAPAATTVAEAAEPSRSPRS